MVIVNFYNLQVDHCIEAETQAGDTRAAGDVGMVAGPVEAVQLRFLFLLLLFFYFTIK